ncbi:Putative inner membrane protein [Citrobacter freundii]|uniref:Inner membrane protein n=1 Tax=Citrobacter freundii TaxID=546 RepID=A0A7G2IIF1_CITFR|nr:Putative inner membrane protein [Citrobacter freundii]
MNKIAELKRAKRLALSLLLIAAATFVITLFLPPNFWVLGIKAIAEAAMVGALADWFAVVALFRRVRSRLSRNTRLLSRAIRIGSAKILVSLYKRNSSIPSR